MALTVQTEAEYVAKMEGMRGSYPSHLGHAARTLLQQIKNIDDLIAANQATHDACYDVYVGLDAAIDAERATVSTAVDALFTTGMISGDRAAMEASLSGNR